MGAVEEGTKAVGGYITALGSQPVLLVQSLIIAGVVFILYAQGAKSFTEREQLMKGVFDAQTHVREILSQCIVPPDQRGSLQRGSSKKSSVFKLQSEETRKYVFPPDASGAGVKGKPGGPSGPSEGNDHIPLPPARPKEADNGALDWQPLVHQDMKMLPP